MKYFIRNLPENFQWIIPGTLKCPPKNRTEIFHNFSFWNVPERFWKWWNYKSESFQKQFMNFMKLSWNIFKIFYECSFWIIWKIPEIFPKYFSKSFLRNIYESIQIRFRFVVSLYWKRSETFQKYFCEKFQYDFRADILMFLKYFNEMFLESLFLFSKIFQKASRNISCRVGVSTYSISW